MFDIHTKKKTKLRHGDVAVYSDGCIRFTRRHKRFSFGMELQVDPETFEPSAYYIGDMNDCSLRAWMNVLASATGLKAERDNSIKVPTFIFSKE